MKHLLGQLAVLLFLMSWGVSVRAQESASAHRLMAFDQWKPAMATLVDGRKITVGQANIFLKRSRLVYKASSGKVMEARFDNICSVDIDGRHYERIDSLLAWQVDTVGANALYQASIIDMESLENSIVNARSMTNLDLSEQMVQTATLDVDPNQVEWPIIHRFYYRFGGKMFPVQERDVRRHISKKKLFDYKTIISQPDFSWTDSQKLMELLRKMSE